MIFLPFLLSPPVGILSSTLGAVLHRILIFLIILRSSSHFRCVVSTPAIHCIRQQASVRKTRLKRVWFGKYCVVRPTWAVEGRSDPLQKFTFEEIRLKQAFKCFKMRALHVGLRCQIQREHIAKVYFEIFFRKEQTPWYITLSLNHFFL